MHEMASPTTHRLLICVCVFFPLMFFGLFIIFFNARQGNTAFFFLLVTILSTSFSLIGLIANVYYRKQLKIMIEEQKNSNIASKNTIPVYFMLENDYEIPFSTISLLRTNNKDIIRM